MGYYKGVSAAVKVQLIVAFHLDSAKEARVEVLVEGAHVLFEEDWELLVEQLRETQLGQEREL